MDIAIYGGGISGLWTLNRLRALGYDAHLFEPRALGGQQSIASQGIIHGGMKYALNGLRGKQDTSLSKMPDRWEACLLGRGELDLTNARVVQKYQTMEFQNKLYGKLVSLLLKSKVVYSHGNVYALHEPVIDVKSVITELSKSPYIYHTQFPSEPAALKIYTAGMGNELAPVSKKTQRRPLRMIMMAGAPYPLFTHFVGFKSKPLATITTHYINDQSTELVWYIGGQIAEQACFEEHPIEYAKAELKKIMPRVNFERNKRWAYHDVFRAEPLTIDGSLPSQPMLVAENNVCVAWPTKLAMAPLLADKVIDWVKSKNIQPKQSPARNLAKPPIAMYPWESVVDWKL